MANLLQMVEFRQHPEPAASQRKNVWQCGLFLILSGQANVFVNSERSLILLLMMLPSIGVSSLLHNNREGWCSENHQVLAPARRVVLCLQKILYAIRWSVYQYCCSWKQEPKCFWKVDCPGSFRRHAPLRSSYKLPSLFVTVKKFIPACC